MIKMILAISQNGYIGKGDSLAWHIPEELKFFKETTLGHALVFGRKTFMGMGSKALKGRKNYVLTSDKDYKNDGVEVVHDLEPLINKYKDSDEVLFICGGKSVYEQCNNIADEIYISTILEDVDGDVLAPDIDLKNYKVTETINYNKFKLTKHILK